MKAMVVAKPWLVEFSGPSPQVTFPEQQKPIGTADVEFLAP